MIKFSQLMTKTTKDIKNETSLMIYNLKCTLNCIGCFHKNDKHFSYGKFKSEEDILLEIAKHGNLFENIILSGGTFLDESEDDLINFIKKLKTIYEGDIILYDNGMNFEKLKMISPLINGIYLDIKLPIYSKNLTFEVSDCILGVEMTNEKYDSIINSLIHVYTYFLIKKHKSELRTVKYPILKESELNDLSDFIKYNYPNIPYKQNEFIGS